MDIKTFYNNLISILIKVISMTKPLFKKKMTQQLEQSLQPEWKSTPNESETPEPMTNQEVKQKLEDSFQPSLNQEAVAYCQNEQGQWQLVFLKYDLSSGVAKVERLGEANKDKEVVRERFIVECTERDML